MKKKTRIMFLLAFCASCVLANGVTNNDSFAIGNAAFEDENFYSCVVRQFNASFPGEISVATTVSDTVLTDAQLAKMETLNCNYGNAGVGYTDLPSYYSGSEKILNSSGLSKMSSLKVLYLASHDTIGSSESSGTGATDGVDLSGNKKLTDLDLHNDKLAQLSLSGLSNLERVNLGNNSLTKLDVSGQPKLAWLQASYNRLQSLNLSKNTELQSLEIVKNNIQQLDVSNSPRLGKLFADNILVIPYTEYGKTSLCELTASVKFVGQYNTIVKTDSYSFDNESHILTMSKRPSGNGISTVELASKYSESSAVYRIYFGDRLQSEFEKLSSCKVSTDTSSSQSNKKQSESSIKAPDTGMMTGENNGEIIAISVATIGVVATLGYLARYILNRCKHHVKF